MIGHTPLLLSALQGGEACKVPAFIFFLGVDGQMLCVCLLVQDLLGHDSLRERTPSRH